MRIVFIEPKSPDLHIYSRMPLPRLGMILMAGILKNNGYKVEVQIEELGNLKINDIQKTDAVGISIITSTAPRGYKLADELRESGKTVLIGGPHATYLPEEALLHSDFVLRGEADETILPFIQTFEKNSGFDEIGGLSFWDKQLMVHNKKHFYCENLDNLPIPDFDLIGNWQKQMNVTPIMTSRGCPFDCEFCSVTDMFGRKYRFRGPEKVLAELEQHKRLIKQNKIKNSQNWIFFYDDNFAINKKRTKELLKAMISSKLTPRWTAQVSVDVADDEELLFLMAQSGCYLLYIGFESINPKTLEAYNKKQTVEKIKKAIEKIHRFTIRIHGMFVLGADTDDKETISQTIKFAQRNYLETVQFLILTPLPGTRIFRQFIKDKRIINSDWSLYDAHHVVFQPKNFSAYGLQIQVIKAMLKFYAWSYIIKRIALILLRFKDLKGGLIEISFELYGRKSVKEWLKKKKNWLQSLKTLKKNL